MCTEVVHLEAIGRTNERVDELGLVSEEYDRSKGIVPFELSGSHFLDRFRDHERDDILGRTLGKRTVLIFPGLVAFETGLDTEERIRSRLEV